MMSILINQGGRLPQDGNFYIIGKDGIYLSKNTGLIRAVVKVKGISTLQAVETFAKINVPKIPAEIVARALMFFRKAYDQHRVEAVALIYYSETEKKYQIEAPLQKNTYTLAKYQGLSLLAKGYKTVGSIHSHCDFSAFHSGFDRRDEDEFDGIHITLGHIDQPYFTIDSELTVNGNPFQLNPEDLVEGIHRVDYSPTSKCLKRVRSLGIIRRIEQGVSDFLDKIDQVILGEEAESFRQRIPDQYYDLALEPGKDYRNYPPSIEWMSRISPSKHADRFAKGRRGQ